MRTEHTVTWLAVAFVSALLTGCGSLAQWRWPDDWPALEDLPAMIWLDGEQEPDHSSEPTHTAETKRFGFSARATGSAEIDTLDMTAPGRAGDGHCEHFVFTLRGDGVSRAALMCMYGNNRQVHFLLQSDAGTVNIDNIARKEQPGWHTWRYEWAPGMFRVLLDGKEIGKTEKFRGSPSEAWAGYWDQKRSWQGTWRGVRVGE